MFTEAATTLVVYLLMTAAWPFYPLFNRLDTDAGRYDPDFFIQKYKTNSLGEFTVKVRAGDLLRDDAGGINLLLLNQEASDNLYGKFAFVLQNADTNVGTVQLCKLGGITATETATNMVFTWTAPSFTVTKYVINFGLQSNNALLWSAEATTPTLTIPKNVFQDFKTRMTVEAFTTFDSSGEEKKVSCLTNYKDFQVTSPLKSLASSPTVTAENVKFTVTSLTNGSVGDNPYLDGFSSRTITFDFKSALSFSTVIFHNLKLDTAGKMTLQTSADGVTWTTINSTTDELRFLVFTHTSTLSTRYFRVTFSSDIADLQEISFR